MPAHLSKRRWRTDCGTGGGPLGRRDRGLSCSTRLDSPQRAGRARSRRCGLSAGWCGLGKGGKAARPVQHEHGTAIRTYGRIARCSSAKWERVGQGGRGGAAPLPPTTAVRELSGLAATVRAWIGVRKYVTAIAPDGHRSARAQHSFATTCCSGAPTSVTRTARPRPPGHDAAVRTSMPPSSEAQTHPGGWQWVSRVEPGPNSRSTQFRDSPSAWWSRHR